jgi:hypothetical protein
MFDHRTGAMIALSLLIASPALVFADAERSRDYSLARPAVYQLTSAATSALVPTAVPDMVTAEPGWPEQWNGVDFPVRGNDQFAGSETAGVGAGRTRQR